MKNEKLQIHLPEGVTELIIREGEAAPQLETKAPVKVEIVGTIGAPVEFLQKRLADENQVKELRCHTLVSRENLSITLVTNEDDEYLRGTVVGTLAQHPKFVEFGINSGKGWEPNELGQFFKMNRAFFIDKAENMALVTALKNFVANVDSKIEKQKSESGSFADSYSGIVTSNLPGAFKLNIPLFKGRVAEEIEVEFYASVSGREVKLELYSPGACQALEAIRDAAIDAELDKIRTIAPNIAIIEQ